MEKKPEFFIIAGPNGAGKSLNGPLFVPPTLSIFNGDLVFADLCKKYPNYDRDILQGGVAKALEDVRDKALASKTDFAFETNYSSNMATNITEMFKEAGYHTTLIYFGLESLKDSAERVRERTGTGGHHVTPDAIRYNYEEGIKRVNKDLGLFDEVVFVDTRNQNTRIIVSVTKRRKQLISIPEKINWYKKHFEDAVNKLQLPTLLKKKISMKPRSKSKRHKL